MKHVTSLKLVSILAILAFVFGMAGFGTTSPVQAAASAMGVNQCAVVYNTNSSGGLAVRASASTSGSLIKRIGDGTLVKILQGPTYANGYTWWRHDQGGWSAGSYLRDSACQTTKPVIVYTIDSNLLDRTGVSNLSGADIDRALKASRSSNNGLIGYGQAFVDTGRLLGINPLYIAAHAAWETGWGTSAIWRDKNNPFGYGAYDRAPYASAVKFTSKAEGIKTGMTYIKRDYLASGGKYNHGTTLRGMNVHYATDQNWKNGIASIMSSFSKTLNVTR